MYITCDSSVDLDLPHCECKDRIPIPAQGSLIRRRGCPTGFNDLQNFVFLGASGRLGAACDWVWFSVPQGPQKQIECFLHAYRAWRAGRGKACTAAHRQSCHCCIRRTYRHAAVSIPWQPVQFSVQTPAVCIPTMPGAPARARRALHSPAPPCNTDMCVLASQHQSQ